ncbi:uncharacterized protein N7483_002464 [Penicillium malachiteum]|uniref:uncharacterized protein n=1 Tax=Penicillium malachiteum TaxID=1324776 RepID=UPI0025466DC9|nr:uncharacterized protein N7483_002464 [Penicillium malachiteum]KAJ5737339.1 hypothetical protein N7483_002464 [Penicillium malachiteum]
METSDYLHLIATLENRAFKAEKAYSKVLRDHQTTKHRLERVTQELEHAAKLVKISYDLSIRLGAVVDYLVKGKTADDGSYRLESQDHVNGFHR